MAELKFTGNCLCGTRPILSFDKNFSESPHLALLKELFTQIFGVPKHHPKSQPFIDHVYSFSVLDNRIWFRNFQILTEDGALAEIGPRFVLNPVSKSSYSFKCAHQINPITSKCNMRLNKCAKSKLCQNYIIEMVFGGYVMYIFDTFYFSYMLFCLYLKHCILIVIFLSIG